MIKFYLTQGFEDEKLDNYKISKKELEKILKVIEKKGNKEQMRERAQGT